MSLWVEFITASGYLSARKIRSRFQTLVAQCVEKTPYRDSCKLVPDTSDVKLRIDVCAPRMSEGVCSGQVHRADHMRLPLQRDLAPLGHALARPQSPLACTECRGRSEERGIRPLLQRESAGSSGAAAASTTPNTGEADSR